MNNESPNTSAAAPRSSGSTGPRTPAGKATSSQNARKHDLCSRTLRLSPEEWGEYHDMRERYRRDLQPADDVEQTLIDEICFNYWRLQQARDVELDIIAEHPTELPIIALYIRYRTGYERGFYKALDKFHQAQRVRKQQAPVRSAKSSDTSSAPVRSAAPLAAIPLAAAPLAAAPLAAAPLAAEEIAEAALELEGRLEAHFLENRLRATQQLPPIEMPKALAARLDKFVSQNPGALPRRLLDTLKEAA